MATPLDTVQRIVLHGGPWALARHLLLDFGTPADGPLHLLQELLRSGRPHRAADARPAVQCSLGFTRQGLERARVPAHVLRRFALKAPAFWAGAEQRAASHAAAHGDNAAATWDRGFRGAHLDAVLSLHADDAKALHRADDELRRLADAARVRVTALVTAERLPRPQGAGAPDRVPGDERALWMHFGFRDGLSHVGIEGWTAPQRLSQLKPVSRHAPGEFVLGHAQDSGAHPWLGGPGRQVWPPELRAFFHNGSFGVLQQLAQDVPAFERFVAEQARAAGLPAPALKAKLCGRTPEGRPLATGGAPEDDFDYGDDAAGHRCPFGSHVRRMNPRSDGLAHSARRRPLLRRGLPYGPPWGGDFDDRRARGLMGLFFCASLEDQFEHLLAQWADRVPLGSADGGGARDPLIGAHEPGDGPFEIPRAGERALRLHGLRPFTRTVGTAYLFHPSLETLRGIADSHTWAPPDADDAA